jgi:hypothetical protein
MMEKTKTLLVGGEAVKRETLKKVLQDMEGWCAVESGVHVASQPGSYEVKKWKKDLETVLKQIEFEEVVRTCPTHGRIPNAWGCPECVRELRNDVEKLRDDALLKEIDDARKDLVR